MDIDMECVLKNIRWLDNFDVDELRMAKEWRILTKKIHEASLTNESINLDLPKAVKI